MGPLGFAPSEMPFSLAHACAFSYQFAPPVRSASACRANTVQSWARVVGALGEKVLALVPFSRPRALTKSMFFSDQ